MKAEDPVTVAALLKRLRKLMESMTDEQRLELIHEVGQGYCLGCGCEQPEGRYCQCQNDE